MTHQARQPGFITTIAGSGQSLHGGDDGLANGASFKSVSKVISTKNGDIYIADSGAHVIRKITKASGTITTIAGIPNDSGFSGDGGQATSAKLDTPLDLYFDESIGALYVADAHNSRIRMIDSEGTISTVAGDGQDDDPGEGGWATESILDAPCGITGNDKGELFIADTFNYRVRMIGTDSRMSTRAGNGAYGSIQFGEKAMSTPIGEPVSIGLNDKGELFVASIRNGATTHSVMKIDTDGRIRHFAGNLKEEFSGDGGSAVNAGFKAEIRIAVGKEGEVYIADSKNYRVRMVSPEGAISTIAGDGSATHAGDEGPATAASFSLPTSVSVAPNGDLYVSDKTRVRMIYSSRSCFGVNVEDPTVCSGHGK